MSDHIKQSVASLDLVIAEMEQLREEQLRAKSNAGWHWALAVIHNAKILRNLITNFKQ
jgi:hypothetical protein